MKTPKTIEEYLIKKVRAKILNEQIDVFDKDFVKKLLGKLVGYEPSIDNDDNNDSDNKETPTDSTTSSDVLGYPLEVFNGNICSGCNYGQRRSGKHAGIDLAAKSGTNVLSPLDGVVTDAKIRNNACGGTLEIDHGTIDGHKTKTRYCHLKNIKVSKGEKVSKGQVVGLSGGGKNDEGKGRSSGPHLHFELYKDGNHLDPKEYVLASNEDSRKKLWT
jgi:murein DD-endopeptidase MepM/ murein hydrolase activator NlpD